MDSNVVDVLDVIGQFDLTYYTDVSNNMVQTPRSPLSLR
jgi:hypothetical protein